MVFQPSDNSGVDRDLIIRTVLAEAGPNASANEQAAVAHVILNRLKVGSAGGYADNVSGVLHQRNGFESWANKKGQNYPMQYGPNSPAYPAAAKVVDGVLSGSIADPTGGADRFQNDTIVKQRIKAGTVSSQVQPAPDNAQKIGQQKFWNSNPDDAAATKFLEDRSAAAKASADEDAAAKDFLEKRPATTAGTQVAGTQTAPSEPEPVSSVNPQEKGDFSGMFGEMGPQIRAHPYIAGGLAAVGSAGLAAMAPELGLLGAAGTGGTMLWNLLKEGMRGTAIGTAMHNSDAVTGYISKLLRGGE